MGPIPIDGFEIDGRIIEVGEQYFEMKQPNLNALAQDGRWGLEHSPHKYDLIALDAYRPPYIPWHLATLEYFQIVSNRLTDKGAVAINVGRAPGDRRLIDALVVTLMEVFPSVYVMDVPETFNSVIYATKQTTTEEYLYANLFEMSQTRDVHPLLIEAMKITALNFQPISEPGTVFTDDLAPIEWITNNMVLRFMLFGDMEILQ